MRKKKPFAVTPKKAEKISIRWVLPYLMVLLILVASVVRGIFYILNLSISQFWFAVLVNIFWAAYFIPFIAFGVYTVFKYYKKESEMKIFERVY